MGDAVYLTQDNVPGAKLLKDPAGCSVLELKRWMECHGEKKTGKKQDLIRRVKHCTLIQKTVDPKVDGGKWYEIKVSSKRPSNPLVLEEQQLCFWKSKFQ